MPTPTLSDTPVIPVRPRLALLMAAAGIFLSVAALQGDPPATQSATPATQPAVTPAAAVPAGQPAPTTAPDTAALIKQLGSDNPDDRDAAQKELVEMGPAVVPALRRAAENDDDPEIRSRASAALAQMKDHDDNDASLITVHFKDAPAQDVVDEIGRQAHAQFIGYGTLGLAPNVAIKTVTIDADHKPFWDVMSDVCGQLNVCPVLDSPGKNSMRLFPVARNWLTSQAHEVVGPFWVSVAGLYRARSIDMMGADSIDDQFLIRLIVYPEPKLAVTQMSDLTLTEATDDAGNSLMPKPQALAQAGIMLNALRVTRQVNHTIESRLSYPEKPGKRIAVLRGQVKALLAQDVQRFEIDDVMGPAPKITNPLSKCAVKATVSRQGTELYRVTLQCTRDGLSDDKWAAMMNRMGDMTLEDADGHALTSLAFMMPTQVSENEFTATCLFTRGALNTGFLLRGALPVQPAQPATKAGDPKRLTWNVATSFKEVTIPIEFKDLPMP